MRAYVTGFGQFMPGTVTFTAALAGAAVFAASATAAQPPASNGPPVEGYPGKYPFDKVGGVSFLDHPEVRAAVTRAVRDPKVREWLLDPKGSPSPKIAEVNGEVVSTGCQQHACQQRNWAIFFDPTTRIARVCYFSGGAAARWYDGKGGSLLKDQPCP